MARDPIPNYRARLAEFGIAEEVITAMETEVDAAVDEATETAKASPIPSEDIIDRDVWADGGCAWRN